MHRDLYASDVVHALTSVGLGHLGKKLLQSPASELPPGELQAVHERMQELGGAPDGLRAALALYALRKPAFDVYEMWQCPRAAPTSWLLPLWCALHTVPNLTSPGGTRTTVLASIQELFADRRRPLFLSVKDLALTGSAAPKAGSLPTSTYIWLFAFLSESNGEVSILHPRAPVNYCQCTVEGFHAPVLTVALPLHVFSGYPQQNDVVLQNPTWVKILFSHGFVPSFVRKLFFMFNAGILQGAREQRIQRARQGKWRSLQGSHTSGCCLLSRNLDRQQSMVLHGAACHNV